MVMPATRGQVLPFSGRVTEHGHDAGWFLIDARKQWMKMPEGTEGQRPAIGQFVTLIVDGHGTVAAMRKR